MNYVMQDNDVEDALCLDSAHLYFVLNSWYMVLVHNSSLNKFCLWGIDKTEIFINILVYIVKSFCLFT